MSGFTRRLTTTQALDELRHVFHKTRFTAMVSVDPDIIAGVLGYGEADPPRSSRPQVDVREYVNHIRTYRAAMEGR